MFYVKVKYSKECLNVREIFLFKIKNKKKIIENISFLIVDYMNQFKPIGDYIHIEEFDSVTISIVFDWIEKYFKSYPWTLNTQDNNDLNKKRVDLHYWEVLLFDNYTKMSDNHIIEMVRAADYWDLQDLLQTLAIYLAKDLLEKDCNEIYKILYENTYLIMSGRFPETVLYHILLQKSFCKTIRENFLFKQFFYEKNAIRKPSLLDVCLKNNELLNLLDYKDFCFLFKTIGDYTTLTLYDEISSLENTLLYPNLKLNMNHKDLIRDVMDNYLDDEDKYNSFVAGGIFIDYQRQSLFADKFPHLYSKISLNQDIDIFINDKNEKKHLKYAEKIYYPYLDSLYEKRKRDDFIQYTDSDKIYDGVHSFKITQKNGLKINFIFNNEYETLLSFLDSFDFTISKTFYSYESNEIYLPIEIFSEYERIYEKYNCHNELYTCIDVVTLMECPKMFGKYLRKLEKLLNNLNDLNEHFADFSLDFRKRQFLSHYSNGARVDSLTKCGKMFYRLMKYSFKNYFRDENDCKIYMEKLFVFYRIFKNEIDCNCLTRESIVNSLFSFLE